MEQQLSKWFKLAEKWGAVMLIDEADVYLEQRLVTDLKRNSLVSGKLPPDTSLRAFIAGTDCCHLPMQSSSAASNTTAVSSSSQPTV